MAPPERARRERMTGTTIMAVEFDVRHLPRPASILPPPPRAPLPSPRAGPNTSTRCRSLGRSVPPL